MKLLVLVFLVIALVAFVAALRKARGRSGVDLHLIVTRGGVRRGDSTRADPYRVVHWLVVSRGPHVAFSEMASSGVLGHLLVLAYASLA